MKNILFYGPRILATVLLIVLLSLTGIGNPKVVPVFAIFFIAVFAAIFFLNKSAKNRERSAKSSSTLMLVMQLIGLVVFVAAISSLGFVHGIIGFIAWFILFSGIVVGIFLLTRKRQRHYELVSSNPLMKYIYSGVLAVLSVLLPVLAITMGGVIQVAEGKMVTAVILTLVGVLVFIALVCLALFMINKMGANRMKHSIGYLLIIAAAVLPGIMVLIFSKETTAYAGVYMSALLAMVLSYFALDLSIKIS